jgi:hypothetical protein
MKKDNNMTKYNGWTNYETWCLNSWIDNDREWYRAVDDKATGLVNDALTKKQQIEILRSFIIDLVQDEEPKIKVDFYSDILNASIREVNFWEISTNIINEARRDQARVLKEERKIA